MGRIVAGLLVAAVSAGCARTRPRPSAKNVVVFCFDTVRADAFAWRDEPGWTDALTPWIRRAVVYDRARSAAPWTLPSVATVMTGVYPVHHGAGRFAGELANLDRMVPSGLSDRFSTLGEAAFRRGADTAAFTSNPWVESTSGVLRGFQSIEKTATRSVMADARRWLDDPVRAKKPFFLYVHWMDSHGDLAIEDEQRGIAAIPSAELLELVRRAPAGTCADPKSFDCVTYLGYQHGIDLQRADAAALLSELEKRGLLSRTLVVLFSDHGEEFGEHEEEERQRGADPRGYFGAGHGHSLYDEVLRVVLVMWNPSERARLDSGATSLIDVAPTVAARLGWPLGGRRDGRVLPTGGALTGERRLYASGIAYGPPQAAVVDGARKAILFRCPPASLVFDEEADPAERHPVTSGGNEKLAALLDSYLSQEGDRPAVPMSVSSERLATLRSVGYLRGSPAGSAAEKRPATVGVFDRATATFVLRLGNSPQSPFRRVRFGSAGDVPVVGDWNGDGRTDLGVYRAATHTFEIAEGGVVRTISTPFSVGRDEQPLAGDWDGGGRDTVALYRPADHLLRWAAANLPDTQWRQTREEGGANSVVAGKWRCNGRTELAFFSPPGSFRFPADDAAGTPFPFARSGDVPVAGDWNGDGTVTIGVYRPSSGTFFLRNAFSEGPADVVVRFDASPGAVPVVGIW